MNISSAEAESDSSSDSELESLLDDYILGNVLDRADHVLNRDGSIRKVKRDDYSRSAREIPRPRVSV
jgi:hypothetical protein